MKILIVRRDNIGDLICTTPMFEAIRAKYPDAYIAALVNSYNQPAVEANPYLNEVFSFTKAKHKQDGESTLSVHLKRLRLLWKLRRTAFDYVIVCNLHPRKALRLVSLLSPRHLVAYETDSFWNFLITDPVPPSGVDQLHEVERMFRLLGPLGIPPESIPPMTICPQEAIVERVTKNLPPTQHKRVAIHISARKAKQRWPEEKFAELIKIIHQKYGYHFLLFWSPGDENNPFHPGDDQKAERLLRATEGVPVFPVKTEHLSELIAGISVCETMICSDGGGMHIGAALRKPMVCFFGNSDTRIWRPWGVKHKLLQHESKVVSHIGVAETFAAFEQLVLPELSES